MPASVLVQIKEYKVQTAGLCQTGADIGDDSGDTHIPADKDYESLMYYAHEHLSNTISHNATINCRCPRSLSE